MKFGVLTFSYTGSAKLAADVQTHGHASINLGDCMQSLAVRNLYRELGIPADLIVDVDRDTLPGHAGERVVLPMNACFFDRCFPLPETIVPLFVGFQALRPVLERQRDLLKRHEPIGCRDVDTMEHLRGLGVEAFVTGCLTMTLPARAEPPRAGRTLVVYGAGAGDFPGGALAGAPADVLHGVEFISQRAVVHAHPLGVAERLAAERYAAYLLDAYRTRGALVLTPLHHAATPCMAAGIPVIVCRRTANTRFSHLRTLLPVHVAPHFAAIDWRPAPVPMEAIKARLRDTVRGLIDRALRS